MPFLKWVLIVILCLAGIWFLLQGFGASIPLVKFKGAETHDLPVGIAILLVAVCLAAFWKVSSSRRVTESTETR